MNEYNGKLVSVGELIAATIFYIINVMLFPVSLLGYVMWIGKGMLTRGRSEASVTAQGPLSARWFQHNLGTRADEPANRLLKVLPGLPFLGLALLSAPMLLAHRITGYVPKVYRYPFEGDIPPVYEASARTSFFDAAADQYLPVIAQFVILGAGFDTRAYRLPKGTSVRTFEVDTPETQVVKRMMLEKAGIGIAEVTFVAADFEKEDWLTKLVDAGFDTGKPTFFLWEGVIMYLDREAVEVTLGKIAETAKGSAVAFDYFTTEPLHSYGLYWRYGRAMTKAVGEPMKFGIDSMPPSRERLSELLQFYGLTLSKHRTLGQETKGKRAWGGFAIAIVK